MQTIAVVTQKGGAGKTTLAIQLAVAAVRAGTETVLFDLDPQATACNWSDRRDSESPEVRDVQPGRLAKTLSRHHAELAIIDTPPGSETAARAAVEGADLALVPTRPSVNDLETLPNTAALIASTNSVPTLVVLNSVPATGRRGTEAIEAIEGMDLAVADGYLGLRTAYSDSITAGLGVLEYAPRDKAAAEVSSLYNEIVSQLDC